MSRTSPVSGAVPPQTSPESDAYQQPWSYLHSVDAKGLTDEQQRELAAEVARIGRDGHVAYAKEMIAIRAELLQVSHERDLYLEALNARRDRNERRKQAVDPDFLRAVSSWLAGRNVTHGVHMNKILRDLFGQPTESDARKVAPCLKQLGFRSVQRRVDAGGPPTRIWIRIRPLRAVTASGWPPANVLPFEAKRGGRE
jgi:hypothetical protein